MNGISWFFLIFFLVSFIIMMSVMIIFERDKPKHIISWTVVFLFSQLIGYIVFIVFKIVSYKKRNSLIIKQNEDLIYKNIIRERLDNEVYSSTDDLLNFNSLAYGANITANNNYDIFNNFLLSYCPCTFWF